MAGNRLVPDFKTIAGFNGAAIRETCWRFTCIIHRMQQAFTMHTKVDRLRNVAVALMLILRSSTSLRRGKGRRAAGSRAPSHELSSARGSRKAGMVPGRVSASIQGGMSRNGCICAIASASGEA